MTDGGLTATAQAFVGDFVRRLKEWVGGGGLGDALGSGTLSGDGPLAVDRSFVEGFLLPALGYAPELFARPSPGVPGWECWLVRLEVGAPLHFLVGRGPRGECGEALFRRMGHFGTPWGLLVNGREILAYGLEGDTPFPLLSLSLRDLLADPLPEDTQSALRSSPLSVRPGRSP